jgi:dihydroorotate dehydrogenase electron transfer subunit
VSQTYAEISPPRQQFVATVAHNLALCREHHRLVLHLPRFPQTQPGQFIQIACRQAHPDQYRDEPHDWEPGQRVQIHDHDLLSPLALLRRPFSLAGRRDSPDGVELDIIHRVVGIGTDWLSRLRAGDAVSILGPLGNRFDLPPPGHTALLVGGGVGIPPMLYLAAALPNRPAVAFCGATTRQLMPLTIVASDQADEFARHNIPSILSTDDGTLGFRGFVTQALERWIDQRLPIGADEEKRATGRVIGPSPAPPDPTSLLIYTCGPEPMMKRVAEIALARSIPCQIAVERAMACGMGTCQSCVIRVRAASDSKGWVYKLACTDGPVFSAADLLW